MTDIRPQIDYLTECLAERAARLADDAAQYAARLIRGGPYAGEAQALADQENRMHTLATRLDTLRESALLTTTEETS